MTSIRCSELVGLARLELATPPLSRVCSNQLSYRPAQSHRSYTVNLAPSCSPQRIASPPLQGSNLYFSVYPSQTHARDELSLMKSFRLAGLMNPLNEKVGTLNFRRNFRLAVFLASLLSSCLRSLSAVIDPRNKDRLLDP
jgi:hypothetical protein